MPPSLSLPKLKAHQGCGLHLVLPQMLGDLWGLTLLLCSMEPVGGKCAHEEWQELDTTGCSLVTWLRFILQGCPNAQHLQ